MSFRFENTKPAISDADLLDDLRRVGAMVGQGSALTKRTYQSEGKYAVVTFQKRFGSWRAAVTTAGFVIDTTSDDIPDDELFDNLRDCWMRLGHQPRKREMTRPTSRYTHSPYVRRFGSWLNAMKTFCEIADAMIVSDAALSQTAARRGPRDPSLRLRFAVMRRDHFRCVGCGRSPATDANVLLHVDHVLAWANAGKTELDNLQTLCSFCNLGKSDLHPTAS